MRNTVVILLLGMLALAKVNAQHVFYSQHVLQKLYWLIPETCRIDKVTTDTLTLCHDVVQGGIVPIVFRFDKDRVLEHIGFSFLQSGDSTTNNVVIRFLEREFLIWLLTDNVDQTLVSYQENGVSILLNGRQLKSNVLQNKHKLLNLLKTYQGVTTNYDGKQYDVTLSFVNGQKLTFHFPADAELLTGMNKKERDICLAVQLKNHRAKPDNTVVPDYSYLQSLGDSVYVEKGRSFMIPQINNDIFYTKIDNRYSLISDSCFIAETFSNALIVPANREYTIHVTHRMYGNQQKQYTVSSRDFDDFFSRDYDRYFGRKTTENGKLTGTLVLVDRNVGCFHLISVSVSLENLLTGGTMEMQLYSNVPTHNLKTLFGK